MFKFAYKAIADTNLVTCGVGKLVGLHGYSIFKLPNIMQTSGQDLVLAIFVEYNYMY